MNHDKRVYKNLKNHYQSHVRRTTVMMPKSRQHISFCYHKTNKSIKKLLSE